MKLCYDVPGADLSLAGKASAEVKRALGRLGVDPGAIKRTAVAMYEAEMNMVIHGGGGVATAELSPDRVVITMADRGPGIPDLELAMREGYSTAPAWIREMGFGAGMGLPNMERNADELHIDSTPGKGTTVTIVVNLGGVAQK
ncbi:MAG: anti-sigma regulatory factor [Spirochaetae bacterium HGW-Spirochaetae-7]|jgi:anti-sigma regulatory factor (Ser/Thr protein kinase)|nr:MAG: anti-sigma regulatory factor [Spirochaetae bacterium HGW-Spirochaetae-7]